MLPWGQRIYISRSCKQGKVGDLVNLGVQLFYCRCIIVEISSPKDVTSSNFFDKFSQHAKYCGISCSAKAKQNYFKKNTYQWLKQSWCLTTIVISAKTLSAKVLVCPTSGNIADDCRNLCKRTGSTTTVATTQRDLLVPNAEKLNKPTMQTHIVLLTCIIYNTILLTCIIHNKLKILDVPR